MGVVVHNEFVDYLLDGLLCRLNVSWWKCLECTDAFKHLFCIYVDLRTIHQPRQPLPSWLKILWYKSRVELNRYPILIILFRMICDWCGSSLEIAAWLTPELKSPADGIAISESQTNVCRGIEHPVDDTMFAFIMKCPILSSDDWRSSIVQLRTSMGFSGISPPFPHVISEIRHLANDKVLKPVEPCALDAVTWLCWAFSLLLLVVHLTRDESILTHSTHDGG